MRNWIDLFELSEAPEWFWFRPQDQRLDYVDGTHSLHAWEELGFGADINPEQIDTLHDDELLGEAIRHGWVRGRYENNQLSLQGRPKEVHNTAKWFAGQWPVSTLFVDYTHEGAVHDAIDNGTSLAGNRLEFLLKRGRLPSDMVMESAPRTLYHGTLKEYLPEIEENGLVPTVGDFVNNFYDPSGYEGYDPETDALEPLVFAATRRDLQRCVNAIVFRLRDARIPASDENVIKYGAIVAYRDDDEQFHKRPADDSERDYTDHPTQVEPGDFYSYNEIMPTYIVTGKRLRDLLRRNRINGFFSTKPVD